MSSLLSPAWESMGVLAFGSEAALLDKAAEIGQRWLRGLGVARSLSN